MKCQTLHGPFLADFYVSDDRPPVYHAVITKQHSSQIITWIQNHSHDRCQLEAAETIGQLTGLASTDLLLFPAGTARVRRLKDPRVKSPG
jgi:hypothetical protein